MRSNLLESVRIGVLLCTLVLLGGPSKICAQDDCEEAHLAYSDLRSGPASGGEGDQGTIVTVFGCGFGEQNGRSFVLLAGVPVQRILKWTSTKIAFQVGSSAKSGEIRISSDRGTSNALSFFITGGNIHFVSIKGKDDSSGSFKDPWRTIPKAAHSSKPGDVTYVMDGVRQANLDEYNAALSIESSGQPRAPIALVAYPGAAAVIGQSPGLEFGMRTPAIHGGPFDDWIIAGFTIRGANTAIKLNSVSRWRIVNNDFSCPNGDGASACVEVSDSSMIEFLGNSIHDAGRLASSKRYHSVYFTTDSNHIEVGWNTIANNQSCRGIQFHSSPLSKDTGFNQFDLSIHDNIISGQVCDGLNLATIDPSKGRIAVFNNVIFHVGIGPNPPDGQSSYACISSPGIVNRGNPGSGTVEVFNNTLIDCGSEAGSSAGAFNIGSGSPAINLTHNLINQRPGRPYFTSSSSLSRLSGEGNLWGGSGTGPQQTTGNLEGDPCFMQNRIPFRLSKESPAKLAVHNCGVDNDITGKLRNKNDKCSIGAYE